MADFIRTYERTLLNYINETIDRKAEQLVVNLQMSDSMVHYHRGYIAALRDEMIYIQTELPKKLNEVQK